MVTQDQEVGSCSAGPEISPVLEETERQHTKAVGVVFLSGVAGLSILSGFGFTVALAKKKDPTMFSKGLVGSRSIPESGGALAMRALGIGTLYAVSGFGLFCFGVWKLMGVKSMEEFTAKIQSSMPRVPRNEPQGKSDFKTVRELVDYILQEDIRTPGGKKS